MAEQPIPSETSSPNAGTAQLATEERKAKVIATFQQRLKESASHRKEWMDEARTLYDLAAGRQWDPDDEAHLIDAERPVVTFNVAGKYLDALTGLQINNRQDIRYAPREPGDVAVNEVLTGAVGWGRDLSGMADDETDGFYDAVLCGEGWMEGFIDRDLDPSGVPCGERVDPLEMFPDPVSRRRNYEDARYLIRLKWISQEDYEDVTRGIPELEEGGSGDLAANIGEDGTEALQFITTPHDYGTSTGSANAKRLKPLADYQWYEREDSVRVVTPQFGEQIFAKAEWALVKQQLDHQKIPYQAEPFKRRRYFRAIIAGATPVQIGYSPTQSGFTFKAITGKRDRNKRLWYGVGRALLDPQKWVNKFFATILFTLMTNAKGGVMAEENTFTDVRKAEDQWSSPDSITHLKEGALQKGKIQPKPQNPYPQGMDRLMEFSLNALPQTTGLNLELLGLADRVQAGVVEAQRKQSAMAIVAWAFDGMRRYYRSMGRMLAEYVRDYMKEGTLIQIQGEKGKQYVPLVKQQLSTNFDVIVDEAPTSVNQQERVWAVLEKLIPELLQAGMQIPPAVIEYAPLPQDLKDEWAKMAQPDPAKQQHDQGMLKGMLDKLMAEVQKIQSDATLDQSTAELNKAKAQQIYAEIQAGPMAQVDPNAELQLEAWKAQMQAAVDRSIAELKANRDQETRLLIAQLQADTEDRQAMLKASIDAALGHLQASLEDRQHKREQETQKAIAGASSNGAKSATEAIAPKLEEVAGALKEHVKTLKRPRKIKRNADGDVVGTELA
jgi:hypothetical protein